jgi:hypothetical protein
MTRRAIAPVVAACFFSAVGSSYLLAADIVPLTGRPAKGSVTAIDAQFVTYKDESGAEVKVSVKELAAVDLGGKVAAPVPGYDEVELTDGTLFRVAEFRLKGKDVLMRPGGPSRRRRSRRRPCSTGCGRRTTAAGGPSGGGR